MSCCDYVFLDNIFCFILPFFFANGLVLLIKLVRRKWITISSVILLSLSIIFKILISMFVLSDSMILILNNKTYSLHFHSKRIAQICYSYLLPLLVSFCWLNLKGTPTLPSQNKYFSSADPQAFMIYQLLQHQQVSSAYFLCYLFLLISQVSLF